MIIFGTKAKTKTVGKGKFNCPHCQREREYERRKAKRYFSIYFIPLIPMDDIGEFIECQTCHRSYSPEVLKYKPSKPQSDTARVLNIVKDRLDRGFPIEYVISDLTQEGFDRDIAKNMITMAGGLGRKTCPKCELTYADSVERCPDCQLILQPIQEG